MKIFDLKSGLNTRRVRIFLAEKGLEIPRVEVDMAGGENQRPEYLAKNPMGTMPLLELDDGTVIAESIAICRYFEILHPDPPLFGVGALGQAAVEMWNRRMEIELMRPLLDNFVHLSPFWKGRREQIAEAGHAGRTLAEARMRWLDEELSRRAYIVGDTYTIADITAQCALLFGKNTGAPIPTELTNLTHWFATVTKRPSARA
jgi:glutathione S-transferase